MKRRKHRSGRRRSWYERLFGIQKKAEEFRPIDPSLLRGSADVQKQEFLPAEQRPSKRRRRSFWRRLFRPHRRHRRSENVTPLIIRPIEPEVRRKRFQLGNRIYLIINSTSMYLLAYLLVYLLYQLTVIFVANYFDISGVLYFHKVFWPIGDNSSLWFPYYKIIFITGSGPFFSLFIGLLFYRIFFYKVKRQSTKLFFLWIALHAINMFFGAFVAGVTTNDGFGYVALWLYMNLVFRIIFSFVCLFALAAFGYYSTRLFYETAQSQSYLKTENKKLFIFYQALVPSILGAIVMILVRIPENPPYQLLLLFTILAATITAFFNSKAKSDRVKYFPKHHGRRFEWIYFLILAGILLLFRWFLYYGLHIIIRISFSLNIFGAPQ